MSQPRLVLVNDKMQRSYRYECTAAIGAISDPDFQPHVSPAEMLAMGVFEGKYLNDCTQEFPSAWFTNAKLAERPDARLNFFGVQSRQALQVWQQKGWILAPDPRGWFQWYCRYYMGRRLIDVDKKQIKRWRAFARHAAQVRQNCDPADVFCRPKQRQALLQWAYDPLI
ncbi:hypothetical protein NBRC116601_04180 [Cognatishimia sp. WU-CL00825]|uniref:hypothetical protein n=1 Tax=Cognatishimia sp. WU-CL00825 TaxID=3127658 RepID=UPI0031030BB0